MGKDREEIAKRIRADKAVSNKKEQEWESKRGNVSRNKERDKEGRKSGV